MSGTKTLKTFCEFGPGFQEKGSASQKWIGFKRRKNSTSASASNPVERYCYKCEWLEWNAISLYWFAG